MSFFHARVSFLFLFLLNVYTYKKLKFFLSLLSWKNEGRAKVVTS